MGLLSLFKKKENKKDTEKKPRNDFITGIAEQFSSTKSVSFLQSDNYNCASESLENLIDGELPFGWYSHNQSFIEPRDSELIYANIQWHEANNIEEEKKLIEVFLDTYHKYKKECEQMGECYVKYFSDMHEHCHNSQNPDFAFCEPAEERLKYIIDHFDELTENEKIKKDALFDLDKNLLKRIKEEQGLIQSELIKEYDPIVKEEVSSMLYRLAKEEKIIREKKGRSYKLYIK